MLKERGVHATFFMIGSRIAADPDLARRVVTEGHELGNHTYTHAKLTTLADEKVAGEIELTQRIMHDQLAYTAKWFRPPFGAFRQNQAARATKAGLGVVLWSIDSNDWSQPGEERIVEGRFSSRPSRGRSSFAMMSTPKRLMPCLNYWMA